MALVWVIRSEPPVENPLPSFSGRQGLDQIRLFPTLVQSTYSAGGWALCLPELAEVGCGQSRDPYFRAKRYRAEPSFAMLAKEALERGERGSVTLPRPCFFGDGGESRRGKR